MSVGREDIPCESLYFLTKASRPRRIFLLQQRPQMVGQPESINQLTEITDSIHVLSFDLSWHLLKVFFIYLLEQRR